MQQGLSNSDLNLPLPGQQLNNHQAVSPLQNAQSSSSEGSSDELDQVWITKAKAIVDKMKDNPYQLSNELGKTKADYLKTRFNKQLKIGPDQTL